jgi:hypothetical protein
MKQSELLGTLMPGNPVIFPIIENIREKYGIPEIRPEDEDMTEVLLTSDIDWESVHRDIEAQVREIPLYEDKQAVALQGIKQLLETGMDYSELDVLREETRETIKNIFDMQLQTYAIMFEVLEKQVNVPLTPDLFPYHRTLGHWPRRLEPADQ